MEKDLKILIIAGDFVEDYEIMVPFQALQAMGYTVHAVCPGKKSGDKIKTAVHDFEGDQTYTEKPGHNFILNHSFSKVSLKDYDGLLIPGGRAPEYLSLDKNVLKMVRYFFDTKKPVASICHGIHILAAAEVLRSRKCTCYPAVQQLIISAGGVYQDIPIDESFQDGNLVTAPAWPAHPKWIQQFHQLLKCQN